MGYGYMIKAKLEKAGKVKLEKAVKAKTKKEKRLQKMKSEILKAYHINDEILPDFRLKRIGPKNLSIHDAWGVRMIKKVSIEDFYKAFKDGEKSLKDLLDTMHDQEQKCFRGKTSQEIKRLKENYILKESEITQKQFYYLVSVYGKNWKKYFSPYGYLRIEKGFFSFLEK